MLVKLTEENARLKRQVTADSALWQIAHQDPLTTLWNRRYADLRLAEEISRAMREGGYRFSMVLVDVDNLKRVNDQGGHAAGDEALRWVAAFLRDGLRGHDLCCRIGGDEFLLILPSSGEPECNDLVARIRRRWRELESTKGTAIAVSIGCASFPTQGTTVEGLLDVADDGMYADKRRRDPTHPARVARIPEAPASLANRSRLPDSDGEAPARPVAPTSGRPPNPGG
jgi:diguanylate cyclase (GGDEF)-like protein